jgi:hypothetical protein
MNVTRILLGLVALAAAAPAEADTRAAVYAVGALGGWTGPFSSGSLFGAAGGAEAVIDERLGLGGELGVVANQGNALLTFSAGPSLRFRRASSSRVVPFVAGGYTLLQFFELADHGYHVGAGVDVGGGDRHALRVEFRDVIRPTHLSGPVHYWSVRVGMSFR